MVSLQLLKVVAVVLLTLRARFMEHKWHLIGIAGWFLTQVLWCAALGDFLSRLHALPLQNQSGSAGICHQWRKNGSTEKLSRTSVSISLLPEDKEQWVSNRFDKGTFSQGTEVPLNP